MIRKGLIGAVNAVGAVASGARDRVVSIATSDAVTTFLQWAWWLLCALFVGVASILICLLVLWCCFLGATASTVALRSYLLADLPQHQVIPVELNLAPLEGSDRPWSSAKNEYDSQVRLQQLRLRDAATFSSECLHAGGSVVSSTRTVVTSNRGESSSCSPSEGSPSCSTGKSTKANGEHAEGYVSTTTVEERAADAKVLHCNAMRTIEQNLIETWIRHDHQRLDQQLDRKWNSLLATGTIRMFQHGGLAERSVAQSSSESSDDVQKTRLLALYGGEMNVFEDANGMKLFNARGTYGADVQLVFLREAVSRPVSLLVSAVMLALDASPKLQGSIDTLQEIFHREQSTSVHTGTQYAPRPNSLAEFLQTLTEYFFAVPLQLWRLACAMLQESGGPYPPLSIHGDEVAVVLPLYRLFHPTLDLQRRLRALNITVRQRLEGGVHQGLLHLVRAHVSFSVELEGVVYYLSKYPILTSVVMTTMFMVLYVLWAICVSICMGAGLVYAYILMSAE